MISKKVSNELGMVFLVLLITLPLTWASTYFLMNAFPALKDNDLLPLVQIAIGAPAALLSSWLLWRKWIKL